MERVSEFQDKIDQFGWSIEVPNSKHSDTAKVYLIRHGLSMYNLRAAEVKAEFGESSPEFEAIMKDCSLIDPDLHPVGVA